MTECKDLSGKKFKVLEVDTPSDTGEARIVSDFLSYSEAIYLVSQNPNHEHTHWYWVEM